MKFVFPMTKDNGEEYPDQQSLETQLKREKAGQFGYNPNNKSWHGGIHFTENNAKWLKRQQAIRAIADGKIVACRIGSDYQVAEFKGQQLTYSNDFCLIEHEADYKEGDVDNTFTFYSLYQHLAPHCEPHVAIGLGRRYVMTKTQFARAQAGKHGDYAKLEKDVVIEETDEKPEVKDGYEFRKFHVVDNPGDGKGIADSGKDVWIAVRETKNLLKSFATKQETEAGSQARYQLRSSSRNVRKQAGIKGHAEKLHKDTVIEMSETPSVIKDGYEFRAVKIIENKGTNTTLVKNGAQVWLACRTSDEIFSSFVREVSPDWMVDGVIAKVASSRLTVRSDPDAAKNIGDKILTVKQGTRFFYQKTQYYGLFNLNGKPRLFARCKFVDGDVKTAEGTPLSAGWLCIEPKYIQVLARKPLEPGQFHQLGNSSAYSIRAGDPIGYLGRFDKIDTRREDFTKLGSQIHFEVFSKDKPPEGFFKLLMDEESVEKLQWIEDKDSDGFVDKPEPPFLFQEVTRLASGESGAQTLTQIEDALLPWDSFKSIVAYHESEWYPKAAEKSFLDDLLDRFKHSLMKDIIEHEKERIDQLVWMQDETKIGFGPLVWHWWPVMESHGLVTFEMIKAVTSDHSDNDISLIVESLNLNLNKYEINTRLRVAHFIAQIAHESNFQNKSEGGSYSAKRMREYFGCKGGRKNYSADLDDALHGRLRPKLWTQESKYERNSKNLLSYVYASRMGNGNEESGDGYSFRGRGFIQLTGKTNYINFQNDYNSRYDNKIDLISNPDLITNDYNIGLLTSLYFWKANNLNLYADKDDIINETKAINGGLNGINDRKNKLKTLKEIMGGEW